MSAALRSPWWYRPPLAGASDGVSDTREPLRFLPQTALRAFVVGPLAGADPLRVAALPAPPDRPVVLAAAHGRVGRGPERAERADRGALRQRPLHQDIERGHHSRPRMSPQWPGERRSAGQATGPAARVSRRRGWLRRGCRSWR